MRLHHPAQRLLIALAVPLALPWVWFRLVGGIANEVGVWAYLRAALISPFAAVGPWAPWYHEAYWYDSCFVFSTLAALTAFTWDKGLGRVAHWVEHGRGRGG